LGVTISSVVARRMSFCGVLVVVLRGGGGGGVLSRSGKGNCGEIVPGASLVSCWDTYYDQNNFLQQEYIRRRTVIFVGSSLSSISCRSILAHAYSRSSR